MRLWRWILLLAAGPLAAGLAAAPTMALSVSGRSSTVLEWYDDPDEDHALPAYQYLLLSVRDLGWNGVNFHGYGRLGDDLRNQVDADSRLYVAYLEKANLLGRLDVRLGRQFISTTAGASVLDGVDLRLRKVGPLAFQLFGGGDVTFDEAYGAGDWAVGGEIAGHFFDQLDLGVSYLQKWDDGDLAQELVGVDANWNVLDILDVYGELQLNYLTNGVSYFLGGAKYHRSPAWALRAEYLYSLPVFDATSIYSVFAVEEYEEILGEFTYFFGGGLQAFGRYTHEFYDELSDANVYEVGVEQIRIRRFSGYIVGTLRDDADGQDLRGIKVRAAYLFGTLLQLGAGIHLDVLERDQEEDHETTSKRYWGDATVYFGKKINVQAKVERVESQLWDFYNRGRIRLNVLF